MYIEIPLSTFFATIVNMRHTLKKVNYGLEITGSQSDGWIIWNIINQFTLGYELEIVGHAKVHNHNMCINIDDDLYDEFKWFTTSTEGILYQDVSNYLDSLRTCLKYERS